MVNRLVITLEPPEYSGLLKIALAQLRNPQDQLRYILREELQRYDLLLPEKDLQVKRKSNDKQETN